MISKYANLLRDKGFKQMPPVRVDGATAPLTVGSPLYMMMSYIGENGITWVRDELGHIWMAVGVHSFEGVDDFRDASDAARAVADLLEWKSATN